MKQSVLLLFTVLVFIFYQANAQIVPVQNGDEYSITVEDVQLVVDASFGARITSFKLGELEMLIPGKDMTGSTLWTSPQDAWGWPPLKTTDSEAYTATIDGNKMSFESGVETGLSGKKFKFIKTFWANEDSKSISIRYTLANTGTRNISAALWEVSRVKSTGVTFWEAGDQEPWFNDSWSASLKNAVEVHHDYYWMPIDNYDEGNDKFFSGIGESGWYGHVNSDKALFIKSFKDLSSDEYAPGEAEFEYYMGGSYIELENQGKYETVLPGDSLHYVVTWFLRALPEDVAYEVGNEKLIEFAQSVVDEHQTTAVDELALNAVKLYPNPAQDVVFISLPKGDARQARLYVYNLSGTLLQSSVIGTDRTVNVEQLQQGVYFYSVEQGARQYKGKLIIQ